MNDESLSVPQRLRLLVRTMKEGGSSDAVVLRLFNPLLVEAADEIDILHAENTALRKLADLNALRRTLTDPALQRLTRAAKP